MNVLTTEYSLKQEALEVYLSGCKGPHCPGCHNPESWDFRVGVPWRHCLSDIDTKLVLNRDLIENIWILGGEPLDQPEDELVEFLTYLKDHGKHIWLFTRYELDEVPSRVKELCAYIKTGRYDESLKGEVVQYGVALASTNQQMHKSIRCH